MRFDCHGKIRVRAGKDHFAEITANGDQLDINLDSLRALKSLGKTSALIGILRRALVLAQKIGFTMITVRLRDRAVASWTASSQPSFISRILRLPGVRIHASPFFAFK